jgi:hypothetical protein
MLTLMVLAALAIAWGQPPANPVTTSAGPIELPLMWPLRAPSPIRVQEARDCDIAGLISERYPQRTGVAELANAYTTQSACDWAVMYCSGLEDSLINLAFP